MLESRSRLGDRDRRLDSIEQRGERIVVAVSWADREGERHRWAHVLELRDGKIIDMQDHASPRLAAAAARLRALAT